MKVGYVVQSDGCRIGAAVMDVESPAASRVPLVIPHGSQLLHVTVNGVPVDNAPEHVQEVSVPILLQAPKSRVEMLFRVNPGTPNEMSASKSRVTLLAPRLGELPVERSTWTIAAPRGLEPALPDDEGTSAGPDMTFSDDAGDLAAEWHQFAANSGNAVSRTFNGLPNSITVGLRATDQRNWHWWEAVAFVVASVLIVVLVRKGDLTGWVQRRPNLAGIILGIAWWLWASPSALGLAIVAAILARQAVIRWRPSAGLWSEPVVPSSSGRGLGEGLSYK